MADSGIIVSETLCPGRVGLELKIFSSLKGQVDSWPKKVKQHCLKVLHTHACVMIITRSSLPNNTNLKIERDQNKQHTLHPWLSAQFCRTLCARDMEGFNDCNPLQSTSFPLGCERASPHLFSGFSLLDTDWAADSVDLSDELWSSTCPYKVYAQQLWQEHVLAQVLPFFPQVIWRFGCLFVFLIKDIHVIQICCI